MMLQEPAGVYVSALSVNASSSVFAFTSPTVIPDGAQASSSERCVAWVVGVAQGLLISGYAAHVWSSFQGPTLCCTEEAKALLRRVTIDSGRVSQSSL